MCNYNLSVSESHQKKKKKTCGDPFWCKENHIYIIKTKSTSLRTVGTRRYAVVASVCEYTYSHIDRVDLHGKKRVQLNPFEFFFLSKLGTF